MGTILTVAFIGAVARVLLIGLGVGVVSYVGLDSLLSYATDTIVSQMSGIGGDAAALAGLAKIDVGVNLILSGYNVRIALIALKRFRIL